MNRNTKHAWSAVLAILLLAIAGSAAAQASRTWVSGVGDDANPCSRTAPCKTFAGAISKTAASGEISVLDPGGYGAVTITKSITIDGGGFVASIVSAGTNGVVINSATADVVLRNIQITGFETGIDGVRILNARSVTLDNLTIQQFNSTSSNGVNFAPTAAGQARLLIINSRILQNGGTSGFGVLSKPTAPASALVVIANSEISQNRTTGLRAEAGTTASVRDSVFSLNANSGIQAFTGGSGQAHLSLEAVTTSSNGFNGIKSDGNGALVLLSNSTIFGNLTGLNALNGGQIVSFQNNRVGGNVSDNNPTGTLTQR